jgi:BlaI family penicillinase repressor
MPREKSDQPTEVELAILEVLWRGSSGGSTVREVHNKLRETRDRGYSTTLKMMQVMLEKGLLKRDDSVRPQVYRPSQKESKTQLGLLDSLARKAFGGSAQKIIASLVSNKRLSAEEIEELKLLLDKGANTRAKPK